MLIKISHPVLNLKEYKGINDTISVFGFVLLEHQ